MCHDINLQLWCPSNLTCSVARLPNLLFMHVGQGEQQILGASNVTGHYGRILPDLVPSIGEVPPGFIPTTNLISHSGGIGLGEQVSGRNCGWEVLLPSCPTPNLSKPAYVLPALNTVGPEMMPSIPAGIMKDNSLFKNPFDMPRDQLLRYSCLGCPSNILQFIFQHSSRLSYI